MRDNIIVVKKEKETIIVRLLEGDFPEYDRIIEKKNGTIIELDKYDFSKTLKRMSILTDDRKSGLLFILEDNKMIVKAQNTEFGESKEEVKIDFSEEKIEIVINPNFLLDTMSVMEGDSVYVNIVNGSTPCIIEGSEGNLFSSVIMPMRI